MKRLLVMVTCLLAVFSFMGPAQALNLQVGDLVVLFDGPGGTGGGEFNLHEYNSGPPASYSSDFITTFCLERTESITLSKTSPLSLVPFKIGDISNNAIKGGVGSVYPPGDPLSRDTEWLYYNFVMGTLPGYDRSTLTNWTLSADGLQLAIWFLEGEITSTTNAKALYFLGLDKSSPIVGGDVKVLNLNALGTSPGSSGDRQSMLHYVPEPGTLVLAGSFLLMGIGLTRGLRRDD